MTSAVNGGDPLQDLELLSEILNPAPVTNTNNDNNNQNNATNVLTGDPTTLQQVVQTDLQYQNLQEDLQEQAITQQNVKNDGNKPVSVPVLRGLRNAGYPRI